MPWEVPPGGTLAREIVAGRAALHMRGEVSLKNNGSFVRIALDLTPDGSVVDAGAWNGIDLDVVGNDQEYGLRLRTDALERP